MSWRLDEDGFSAKRDVDLVFDILIKMSWGFENTKWLPWCNNIWCIIIVTWQSENEWRNGDKIEHTDKKHASKNGWSNKNTLKW